MEAARRADPVRQDRLNVFTAWADELNLNERYLVADLADLAEVRNGFTGNFVRPQLHAALLAIAQQRGAGGTKIDARRLGIWLKKNENTVVKNLKLTVDRADYQRPRWSLGLLGE